MRFIIFNYTYGNGPLARCFDILAASILKNTKKINYGIILPENNISTSKKLIINYFLESIKLSSCNIEIFLCNQLSRYRQKLYFQNPSDNMFNLRNLSKELDSFQEKIYKIFAKKITLKNIKSLNSIEIDSNDIVMCISRCSIYSYPIKSIEISYGPQSKIFSIWKEQLKKKGRLSEKSYIFLDKIIKKYNSVEEKNVVNYLSIPSSLTSELKIESNFRKFESKEKFVFCPPLYTKYNKSKKFLYHTDSIHKNNLYIYFSGTNITEKTSVINYLKEKIPNKFNIFTNKTEFFPNSIYQEPLFNESTFKVVIARAGWGLVWNCLILSIPLVIFPPNKYDDPEINLNYQTLIKLNLVLTINELESPNFEDKLYNLKTNMDNYKKQLIKTFGTLSGPDFIAKHGIIDKFIS